jgi:hypothetical protein
MLPMTDRLLRETLANNLAAVIRVHSPFKSSLTASICGSDCSRPGDAVQELSQMHAGFSQLRGGQ